ncbi:hypothetical protein ARMGADRAFT_1026415 [Armillaria gallica]|uniref:Uncharacterized protein n=1 Tax=Armillaria gallica TaxID=47427 RepID=A0A2H3ED60_ARMGA|nr:hypothetical protein ARMGADRAFT_1026415 [Armillaria gallica]
MASHLVKQSTALKVLRKCLPGALYNGHPRARTKLDTSETQNLRSDPALVTLAASLGLIYKQDPNLVDPWIRLNAKRRLQRRGCHVTSKFLTVDEEAFWEVWNPHEARKITLAEPTPYMSELCEMRSEEAREQNSGNSYHSLTTTHRFFCDKSTFSAIQGIIRGCENGILDCLDNSAPYMFSGTTYGLAQEDLVATICLKNSVVTAPRC